MRCIAESGGFCAFHAARIAAIGQSATVALIYLSLIEDCLPRFAARRARRGGPFPVFPAPDACAACAHQQEVERRECFFLALLIRTRGSRCYGAPALVCMRHLPPLLEYLDERSIGDILARHLGVAAALKPENAADAIMRLILGPRGQRSAPLPRCRTRAAPIFPIPFAGCAAACASCPPARSAPKSRMPAPSGWAGWQARPRRDARCRMCCRCAATTSGRRVPSPARCWRRRSPRSSCARPSSASHLPPIPRRPAADRGACLTGSEVPSAPHRRGAPLWHRCAAAASARYASVPARPASALCRWSRRWSKVPTGAALSRAAMVCASAMRHGRWRCRMHPPSATSSRNDPCPAGAAALGAGGADAARRLAGPAAAARRRIRRPGSGPARALPAPYSAGRLTAPPRQRIL